MSYYDLKQLHQEKLKLGHDAREIMDSITTETNAVDVSERQKKIDVLFTEIDKIEERIAHAKKLEALTKEIEEIADPRRPSEERSVKGFSEGKTITEMDAFKQFLIHGRDVSGEYRSILNKNEHRAKAIMSGYESRAQGEASGAAGGYLVPTDLANKIIVSLKAAGPMMDPDVSWVVHTDTGAQLNWPAMDDTSNQGSLITENTQVSTTAVSLSVVPVNAYKFTTGIVQYSNELIQDSAFDLGQFLSNAMTVRAGRAGNQYLTTGTGTTNAQPMGIVSAVVASGNIVTSTGGSHSASFDDILSLIHSVDPAYRSNPGCRFQFHDTTLKALRTLKDNYGRYLWQQAVQVGEPDTLYGFKYSVNQAMNPYGTAANNIVLFGDHKVYLTRIVKDFALRVLTERYADYDQQALIGFFRMDGQLLDRSGRALAVLESD